MNALDQLFQDCSLNRPGFCEPVSRSNREARKGSSSSGRAIINPWRDLRLEAILGVGSNVTDLSSIIPSSSSPTKYVRCPMPRTGSPGISSRIRSAQLFFRRTVRIRVHINRRNINNTIGTVIHIFGTAANTNRVVARQAQNSKLVIGLSEPVKYLPVLVSTSMIARHISSRSRNPVNGLPLHRQPVQAGPLPFAPTHRRLLDLACMLWCNQSLLKLPDKRRRVVQEIPERVRVANIPPGGFSRGLADAATKIYGCIRLLKHDGLRLLRRLVPTR